MDERTEALIAIGASMTANCQPCFRLHVEKAVSAGACQKEIATAVAIARQVRKGVTAKMDEVSAGFTTSDGAISVEVVLGANGYDFLGP